MRSPQGVACSKPFPKDGSYSGRLLIRPFVTEHLARDVRLDLTKKQIAHNGVAWKIRTSAGIQPEDRVAGVAEAVFQGSEIESLRLGPATL